MSCRKLVAPLRNVLLVNILKRTRVPTNKLARYVSCDSCRRHVNTICARYHSHSHKFPTHSFRLTLCYQSKLAVVAANLERQESNQNHVVVPNEELVHQEKSALALAIGLDQIVLLTMALILLSMMNRIQCLILVFELLESCHWRYWLVSVS